MTRTVLFLASTLARSGPTQQLLTIASGLVFRGWRPVVLTLSPEGEQSRQPDFQAAGIEVRTLGLTRLAGLVRGHNDLRRAVDVIRPDVVHSHGVRADGLAAGLAPLPRVATIRNVPWLDFPMTYGPGGYGLAAAHIMALRRIPRVVAVSETVRSSLCRFLPSTMVVRNGIDLDRFQPASREEKLSLRRANGIPDDALVVIATGHLSRRKDPALLARAAAGLDVILLLVGDGPGRPAIERLAAQGENVRVLGRQADVRPFLKLADVFASASHAEGFPNAVIEGLATGLPCLLSDIGPHREISALAGPAARLFPLRAADELRGLLATAGEWAAAHAVTARESAERHLGSAAMVDHYEGIYLGLLDALRQAGAIPSR